MTHVVGSVAILLGESSTWAALMLTCEAGSAGTAGALSLRLAQHEVKGRNRAVEGARGPVLQRPLQVEDSIHFLHQRIQECNACLPYTGGTCMLLLRSVRLLAFL